MKDKILPLIILVAIIAISFIGGCSYHAYTSKPQEADTVKTRIRYVVVDNVPTKTSEVTTGTVTTKVSKAAVSSSSDDSISVEIPIAQSIYEGRVDNEHDTIDYKAYVTGHQASLDSILFDVNHLQTTITPIKNSRFRAGVYGGVDMFYEGKLYVAPEIGFGINANLGKRWSVGAGVGMSVSYGDKIYAMPVANIKLQYNIFSF